MKNWPTEAPATLLTVAITLLALARVASSQTARLAYFTRQVQGDSKIYGAQEFTEAQIDAILATVTEISGAGKTIALGYARGTTCVRTVYASVVDWPENGVVIIEALAGGSPHYPGKIRATSFPSIKEPLPFTRTEALTITLPDRPPPAVAGAFQIDPA